jgi:teichuronic acid biosynthesis glycosyltransferase TuaG
MHKVSVIIPTYNRESTLLRAVNSALQQTYPVHEILICDDGSTDNSKNNIAALNDQKIKWIDCGRNGMPAIPRNTGIKAATGDWIAFLDSDDEWLPSKIEKQLNAVEKYNVKAVSTNAFRVVNEQNKGPYFTYKETEITLSGLLSVNLIICSSMLVSKKILEEVSLFPEEKKYKVGEDYSLWMRLSTKINFAYVAEPLLNYNDNPHASIRAGETDEWAQRGAILSGFREWLAQNKIVLDPALENQFLLEEAKVLNRGKLSVWEKVKQKLIGK